MVSAVAGVITAPEPSWTAPFARLIPRALGKLTRQRHREGGHGPARRREGGDAPGRGRPWKLSMEDRALLVAAYRYTNLTPRQLAPLFGVPKSTAARVIDHPGPGLVIGRAVKRQIAGSGNSRVAMAGW
ncbi:hypothetical protein GCM10010277_80470 [Streptomyces longisporoflavus]|nr:hypothetical protein GCM10010277_80470 [Streptomyces longisporoflavus]